MLRIIFSTMLRRVQLKIWSRRHVTIFSSALKCTCHRAYCLWVHAPCTSMFVCVIFHFPHHNHPNPDWWSPFQLTHCCCFQSLMVQWCAATLSPMMCCYIDFKLLSASLHIAALLHIVLPHIIFLLQWVACSWFLLLHIVLPHIMLLHWASTICHLRLPWLINSAVQCSVS